MIQWQKYCGKRDGFIYTAELYREDIPKGIWRTVSSFRKIYITVFQGTFSYYTVAIYYIFTVGACKQLLQDTDMPVTEVALQSGYQNVSYFIRSFKKAYTVSPLKYRKSDENS